MYRKIKIVSLCIVVLLVSTQTYAADSELSFGTGVGLMYSGIGINIGIRGESDFRFISAGCVNFGYITGIGWYSACGGGAGWIWSNVLSKESDKHGIGLYLGAVSDDGNDIDPGTVYGVGIPYVYFLRGINEGGWNFGLTPSIGRHNGVTKVYLWSQVGYQF